MLEVMWYSDVIPKKVKDICEQEKSILILTDLLIRLLTWETYKYKVTIVIYFPINILNSYYFWHDLEVDTISIIWYKRYVI